MKRHEADVEGEADYLNAVTYELVENLFGEVEARSGRGHGSGFVGIHGLVAVSIHRRRLGFALPVNVGRKRHFSNLLAERENLLAS